MTNDKLIPFGFQKDFVTQLLAKDTSRVMIAMDLGLGKTLTSLYWVSKHCHRPKKKILILAQATKLLDWKDEINKCSFISSAQIKICNSRFKAKKYQQINPKAEWDIMLTSYGTLPNKWDEMKDYISYDSYLLVDESQTLKSHRTKIGKLVWKLSPIFEGIALLSGNPMGKHPAGFFNQLKILGEEVSIKDFEDAFTIKEYVSFGGGREVPIIKGFKNLDALYRMLGKYTIFMLTSAAIELPKINNSVIKIYNPAYNTLEKKLRKDRVYKKIAFKTIVSLYTMSRMLTSAALPPYLNVINDEKIKQLIHLLGQTRDNFLIFYNFKSECETLLSKLNELEIKTYQINGSKQEYSVLKYAKERHVVLIQYQSGSKGLNLQNYTRLIQYSPATSYDNYSQSLKRIHRVGQTKPVFYYFFITEKSIEEKIRASNLTRTDYSMRQYESIYLKKL